MIYFSYPTDASFSENFYDLKRVDSNKTKSLSLSKKAYTKSMITLVGYHYVHNKLESLYLKLRDEDSPETSRVFILFTIPIYSISLK